jgi:hypothetical protein
MRALLAAACLLTIAGCGFGADEEEPTVEVGQLESLVLQPEDVRGAFVRFDEGRQVDADQPAGERAHPTRFGRAEGWKARYRRRGSSRTQGPFVIESRADLFESTSGASDELDAHRSDVEGEQTLVDSPRIGDESFVSTLRQPSVRVRYYLVAWRHDNVTASVLVSGFERRLSLVDAVELARRQQRRIAAASA